MNSRWVGAIVVAAVLVAAIVTPNLSGRRIAGEAVGRPLAPPPSPGDCALNIDDPADLFGGGDFGTDEVIEFPSATIGSCAGPIVGEVVSVNPWSEPPRRIELNAYQTETSQCLVDAISYTGSIAPVVEGLPGQPDILWAPHPNIRYMTIGPDLAQRAAGQRWTACVIGSPAQVPYSGRLRNVLVDGWLPPEFGSCVPSTDYSPFDVGPCDRPHTVELLATTSLGPEPTTARNVQHACGVYAGRALRNADPTRQGVLTISIIDGEFDDGAIPTTDDRLDSHFVACLVATQQGRTLTGSLVGIGDNPLPAG